MTVRGATGFRINYSHGSQEQWKNFLDLVKRIEEKLLIPITIIGDLQGPNIRIGTLVRSPMVVEKNKLYEFFFSNESRENNKIPVPVKDFFESIQEGDIIQIGDNMTSFLVKDVENTNIVAESIDNGEIRSRMSIRVKNKEVNIPYLTPKDRQDLLFSIKNGVTHVMISFVRSENDVVCVRRAIKEITDNPIYILAKIETKKAIENLDGIINVSDGIVVARGDLGKVYSLEYLPELQRIIVKKSRKAGKPVYIATQLLTSMIENPIPTRSEVVDVYVSVMDGVDGIMLTNETSIGKYPVETVEWANKIIKNAEKSINVDTLPQIDELSWRFGKGIVQLADLLESPLLIFSLTGKAARISSAFRPKKPLYVGSSNVNVLKDCAILYGCVPIYIDTNDYEEGLEKLKEYLKTKNVLENGTLTVSSYKFSHLDKQKIIIERL